MPDLDSQNKRASAIGIDEPWNHVYPNPDGSLANANDRQQMAYKYAGTLSAGTGAIANYRTLMGMGR